MSLQHLNAIRDACKELARKACSKAAARSFCFTDEPSNSFHDVMTLISAANLVTELAPVKLAKLGAEATMEQAN